MYQLGDDARTLSVTVMVVDLTPNAERPEFDASRMTAALRAKKELGSTRKLLRHTSDEAEFDISRMRVALNFRKESVPCTTKDENTEEQFQCERMRAALRLRREVRTKQFSESKTDLSSGQTDEFFDASRMRKALELRKECVVCPIDTTIDVNKIEVERMKVAIRLRR